MGAQEAMASPAQLVETISAVTGVPLPTVVDIDRKLAKSGFRTVGGRGRSAARMTAGDGARLLTAILASAQAASSAEAVQRYMATRLDKKRSTPDGLTPLGRSGFASLPARHSFVDALAATIDWLILNEGPPSSGSHLPLIEVFAFTGATYGRIRFAGLPDGATIVAEYLPASKARPNRNTVGTSGDLEQSRRITGRTLAAVAHLLSEDH